MLSNSRELWCLTICSAMIQVIIFSVFHTGPVSSGRWLWEQDSSGFGVLCVYVNV